MAETLTNGLVVTVTSSYTNSTTSITVAYVSGGTGSIPALSGGSMRCVWDGEIIQVTANSGIGNVNWTIVRAVESSIAVAHAANSTIVQIVSVLGLQQFIADKISPSPYGLVTTPTTSGFSWFNQGSATVALASGILRQTVTGTGTDAWRIYAASSPGSAFTLTTAFIWSQAVALGNSTNTGLILYDNIGGKLIAFYVTSYSGTNSGALTLQISQYTTVSTFSSTPATIVVGSMAPLWLRIKDDGTTNRVYSISADGINYVVFLTEARTTWVTSPPLIGLGMDVFQGTNVVSGVSCISWALTTP